MRKKRKATRRAARRAARKPAIIKRIKDRQVEREYEAALETLNVSIEMDPTQYKLYGLRATAFRRLDRYEEGLADDKRYLLSGKETAGEAGVTRRFLCRADFHDGYWAYHTKSNCGQHLVCRVCRSAETRVDHEWSGIRTYGPYTLTCVRYGETDHDVGIA